MIEFTKAYAVDGKPFFTLEEAKVESILKLFQDRTYDRLTMAQAIVDNAEEIIDVLTTTKRSKPRARSINGGRKPRKSKAAETASAAQPSLISS